MLRTLRMIAGVLLVILGLAALFTPLTPGSWFALIGLELMGFGFLIPKKVRKFWKKSPIPGPFSDPAPKARHVILVHGIGGHPGENWFPWLKQELLTKGFQVHIPHFPDGNPLSYDAWRDTFKAYEYALGKDCIVVGHSLGAAFLLSILGDFEAKAAFFIAPACGKTNNEFAPAMASIVDRPFEWDQIRKNCKEFHIFHADNDPYLPLERAQTLSRHLQCDVMVIPGAGHFNASSGYEEFPQLLEEILRSSQ
ncbi:MAG: alpha/beta fold hydrolase [Patescibacteria group bacterium]